MSDFSHTKNEVLSQQYDEQQNLRKGILFATIGASIGTILLINVNVQTIPIGYMAVVLGLFTGLGMRIGGKGVQEKYGIIAGIITLISCLLGHYLTMAYMLSTPLDISIIEIFTTPNMPGILLDTAMKTFNWLYGIFILIGIFTAYGIGFRYVKNK